MDNLEAITEMLIDKLCATNFNVPVISQLLKLACDALEKVDPTAISIRTNYKLCMAVVICFFSLLELECDEDEFPKILSFIRVSLSCMSSLRRLDVSSHILCRALLERSFASGFLFNKNFNHDTVCIEDKPAFMFAEEPIRLLKENLKVTVGQKFRRLPNARLPKRDDELALQSKSKQVFSNGLERESINCYLLIQAFKSSIEKIEDFASLFVEFLCPVMLDKYTWQTEEAMRVVSEKSLGVYKKFEQVPALWDLYELIGQQKCLGNCIVLVKSLLSAQLALWASSTSKSHDVKLTATSRLLPPLADSGLIPKEFGLAIRALMRTQSEDSQLARLMVEKVIRILVYGNNAPNLD